MEKRTNSLLDSEGDPHSGEGSHHVHHHLHGNNASMSSSPRVATGSLPSSASSLSSSPYATSVTMAANSGNTSNPNASMTSAQSILGLAREDFILVSEFSEHEGPVPLIAFPDSTLTEDTGFDLSKFVIRIMSVDNQVRVEADTFILPEDNQVFLTELDEHAFAYVRHVTLFDLHARGFVRPLCLSYLTSDPQKIMSHFEEISMEFAKASDYLKMENYSQFLSDLDHRHQDLLFTKNHLLSTHYTTDSEEKEEDQGGDSGYSAISLDNIDSFLKETEIMMHSLRLRGSQEKSAHEKLTNRTYSADRRDSRDEAGSDTRPKTSGKFQPKILKTFHKTTRFDEKLRTIEELCGPGFSLAMTKLQKILNHFKRQNMVLLVEKDEMSPLGPYHSVLSIGKCLVSNFWETPNKDKDRRLWSPAHDPHTSKTPIRIHDDDSLSTGSFESAPSVLSASPQSFVDATDEMFKDATHFDASSGTSMSRSQSLELDETTTDVASTTSSQKTAEHFQRNEPDPAARTKLRKERRMVAVQCFVEHLWQNSDTKAGVGIVAFKKKYNFARHLIFALLKGRPVIIHGQNEKEIRSLITTLSLFVPGYTNKRKIIPWRVKPITLADLAFVKLVGLPKSFTIPKNVERYVSIMDFDFETLKSPPYSGVYVEQIMSRQKNWVDDNAFLAHLHCVFLDLAIKGFIYYHACCVGCPEISNKNLSHTPLPDAEALGASGRRGSEPIIDSRAGSETTRSRSFGLISKDRLREKSTIIPTLIRTNNPTSDFSYPPQAVDKAKKFFQHFEIAPNDREIIEYLVEVVKEQQLSERVSSVSTEEGPPTVKLDFKQPQKFKNYHRN